MDDTQGRAARRQEHFARLQGAYPLPIVIDDLALPDGGRLEEDEFVVRVGKDWGSSVKPLVLTTRRLTCPLSLARSRTPSPQAPRRATNTPTPGT